MTAIDHASRLGQFRQILAAQSLDGFYLTRADRFQGEEVRAGDEYLAYLTGFTGSAGVGLILKEEAALFTDGRYALQIDQQTDNGLYQTYDSAEKNLNQWMSEKSASGKLAIGYDSWAVTVNRLDSLPKKYGTAEIDWIACSQNPQNQIWLNRPAYIEAETFILDKAIAGKTARKKLAEASEELRATSCQLCLITAPDCVNWLANIRGRDLRNTPLHLCFALLQDNGELIFIGSHQAQEAGYKTLDWDELPDFLTRFKGTKIACDPASLPAAMRDMLTEAELKMMLRPEPLLAQKAIKNETEIAGFREAHLRDGLALCQFWHWLEEEAPAKGIGEADIAEKLTKLRRANAGYICDSFDTIAGFRGNGAIVHYRAIKGADKKLDGDGVLLVDSGAHYQMGTTDITRTFYYGLEGKNPPEEVVRNASYVLAAHIELARAGFPKGSTGAQLDGICRAPLWANGLEFGHGTGHGVGHILSVHEGPVSISKRCQLPVEAGMVLSNEPGFYRRNKYGIRHENLMLAIEQSDGFLAFETLTCFPFDKKLIAPSLLTAEQTAWLNAYHGWVYRHLSPHLSPKLTGWLSGKCTAI